MELYSFQKIEPGRLGGMGMEWRGRRRIINSNYSFDFMHSTRVMCLSKRCRFHRMELSGADADAIASGLYAHRS